MLNLFGAQTVLRLSLDPVKTEEGAFRRQTTIDRLCPPAPGIALVTNLEIGWSGLPLYTDDYLLRVSRTVNEHDITEKAAIGVMALLIHELEGVRIESVLPMGSGGDYAVYASKEGSSLQVEVSGIRNESAPGASHIRLQQKRAQVLKNTPRGYVSVTTFCWTGGRTVHSYLHYAEAANSGKRSGKATRKKGKNT